MDDNLLAGAMASRVLTARVPIPKFAKTCGTLSCELRNQRDTSNFYGSGAPFEPEVRNRTRGTRVRTSGSGHQPAAKPPLTPWLRPKKNVHAIQAGPSICVPWAPCHKSGSCLVL